MSAYTRHDGPVLVHGIVYRLTSPLAWRIGHIDGPEYLVPVGFEFDVSVPVGLRWLFNPHRADFHKAAALHDHMLQAGWSRITAAAEFHNALGADGVSTWRRLVMLLAAILWRFE